MNEERLRALLQDLYDYARPKLDERGHGSTYYFHELDPELFSRLSAEIDTTKA